MRFSLARLLTVLILLSIVAALGSRFLRPAPVRIFEAFEPALLEQRRTGRPLLVEFNSVTCTISCLNLGSVISRPAIQERLSAFVIAELWTDMTDQGPENRRLQAERFRSTATPLYVIVAPDGRELRRLSGTLSEPQFLRFLNGATAR